MVKVKKIGLGSEVHGTAQIKHAPHQRLIQSQILGYFASQPLFYEHFLPFQNPIASSKTPSNTSQILSGFPSKFGLFLSGLCWFCRHFILFQTPNPHSPNLKGLLSKSGGIMACKPDNLGRNILSQTRVEGWNIRDFSQTQTNPYF